MPTPQNLTTYQQRALVELMVPVFSTPGELVQFVRWNDDYRRFVYQVDTTSIFTASLSLVKTLAAVGGVNDAFFAALVSHRPFHKSEIERCRRSTGL